MSADFKKSPLATCFPGLKPASDCFSKKENEFKKISDKSFDYQYQQAQMPFPKPALNNYQ